MNGQTIHEAQKAEKYWGSIGMLEGIKDARIRSTTALLLENQSLYLNQQEREHSINEASTTTSDIAQFKRISIPLIRRVFPQLIANKLVSVQPLLGPAGQVYYLRFRYGTDKGATLGATNKSAYPTDDALSMQQLTSGLVNLDKWFSHQQVFEEVETDAGGDTASSFTLKHTPIIAGTLQGTIYDGSTAIYTFTVNAAGTFAFTAIGSPSPTVSAGSISLTSGVLGLTYSGDPGANSVVVTYEYNMECNSDLPEVNLEVYNETIESKTRKLKAAWSFESEQDIRAQFSLNLEQEMTSHIAQELNLEIDREIIYDLYTQAGTTATWDYNSALGDTQKEKFESLYTKLVQTSALIHKKTLRSGANWIVCSPEVAAVFQTATAGYGPSDSSETFTSGLGVQYVGQLNRRFAMYVDPQFPTNKILMGYKGDNYLDSGYFFCPYVPLMQTPLVTDPDSFCQRRLLYSRYGKKLLSNGAKFYAVVTISNLSS